MDSTRLFTESRLLIVAGKGGVGKTTVAAALAVAASRSGIRTLLVELEGKSGIADLFGRDPFGYDEVRLDEDLHARTLPGDRALLDYLGDHGLGGIIKRLAGSGILDVFATSTPGLKDLIVLGKVKQIVQAGDHDLVVLDAPASGHAVTMLRAASSLLEIVEAGPVRDQAQEVAAMLSDPRSTQVLLVTLGAETPVRELVETAYALEDEAGLRLGPIVVNDLTPRQLAADLLDPDFAASFDADVASLREGTSTLRAPQIDALEEATRLCAARCRIEIEALAHLDEELPLNRIELPHIATAALDTEGLAQIVAALEAGIAALPDDMT